MIEHAHHFSFGDNVRWNGEPVTRDPEHHAYIQRLSTAFFDAHLRDDRNAALWLRDRAQAYLGAGATIEHK